MRDGRIEATSKLHFFGMNKSWLSTVRQFHISINYNYLGLLSCSMGGRSWPEGLQDLLPHMLRINALRDGRM